MKTIEAILAEALVRRSDSFGPETPGWVDLHPLHSGNLRVHDRLTQKESSGVGSTTLWPGLVGMSSVFFKQSAILKDDNFAGAMNKHTGPRQTRKTGDCLGHDAKQHDCQARGQQRVLVHGLGPRAVARDSARPGRRR